MHTELTESGVKVPIKTDKKDILFYSFALLSVFFLYFFFYADLPIYGDAWGYGYACSNWIANNDLQLIPSGTGRGETAGGHVTFYFWMWAAVIKLLGDSVKIAHLLPAIFSFLTIAGTYKLGRELGGRVMGIACGIALFVSPLFLSQAFRALPIAAVMASSVWSIFFYVRKKYFTATLFCIFAVMMREQAMVLSIAYIAAEVYFTRQFKWKRALLFAIPFMVPVINGAFNYLVNGFIFLQVNQPGIDQVFSLGLFLERFKFFSGYFFISHFFYIPVAFSAGILFAKSLNPKAGFILGMVLLALGASGTMQNYFMAILILSLLYTVIARKTTVTKTALILGLFPLTMILFFTSIVFVTATSMRYLFFRYLSAAFPALIVGILWALFRYDRRFRLVAILFIVSTAASNFFVRFETFYSDSTLAGYYQPLAVMREAGEWAQQQELTVIAAGGAALQFNQPEVGFTDSSLTVIDINDAPFSLEQTDYVVVVPPLFPWGDDSETALRSFTQRLGTDYRLELSQTITRGPFTASCYYLYWDPQTTR